MKTECTTSISGRARSISYVIYHVLNHVTKEAQLPRQGPRVEHPTYRKNMVKRKINQMDLNVVLSRSIFQKRDETFKLRSYQRSARLNLEYHAERYSKTCIETEENTCMTKVKQWLISMESNTKGKAIDSKVRAITAFYNNWSTDQVQQWQLQPGKEISFRSQLSSFCILCERWYKNQKNRFDITLLSCSK